MVFSELAVIAGWVDKKLFFYNEASSFYILFGNLNCVGMSVQASAISDTVVSISLFQIQCDSPQEF